MKIVYLAAAALCVSAGQSAQAAGTSTPRYICERGVEIPAVYINSEDGRAPGIAVIYVEGRMINLQATAEAASGVRYDGSGYVRWTHQGTAQLIWYDAELGEEITLYAACVES
ncbi:MliC family protein [Loktanella salsilacus]|uniref:MliC family protein n=1 Tax=Loktanella salsilacus TaxID=195913 RepID=UPI0037046E1C